VFFNLSGIYEWHDWNVWLLLPYHQTTILL